MSEWDEMNVVLQNINDNNKMQFQAYSYMLVHWPTHHALHIWRRPFPPILVSPLRSWGRQLQHCLEAGSFHKWGTYHRGHCASWGYLFCSACLPDPSFSWMFRIQLSTWQCSDWWLLPHQCQGGENVCVSNDGKEMLVCRRKCNVILMKLKASRRCASPLPAALGRSRDEVSLRLSSMGLSLPCLPDRTWEIFMSQYLPRLSIVSVKMMHSYLDSLWYLIYMCRHHHWVCALV